MSQAFRTDINGLRAWAVVAVVLYHFGINVTGGGFVGVDVFFVISGYLMCAIISKGLNGAGFSLGDFYLARARRIWPALAVVCVTLLVVGWFFLMPKEYEQLGRHVRESAVFTSNIRYLDEAGYFDVASQEKWLLHTWSLSVEWQFYLLLPVILLGAWKLKPSLALQRSVVLALFVSSFIACLVLTQRNSEAAFYLLYSRAWEMLAGALVFYYAKPKALSAQTARMLEWAGFALIIGSIVGLHSGPHWPGAWALLPVLGAVLVLTAARQQSIFTGSAIAQWLGTRSYSIYLWHWPLVVALAYTVKLDQPLWVAGALLASLILGDVSYRWVETPARKNLTAMGSKKAWTLLLVALLMLFLAAQAVRRTGIPERMPSDIARIDAARDERNPRLRECLDWQAQCVYGQEPVRLVVIGDSHADAVVNAVTEAIGGGVLFRGASGCPIVFGIQSSSARKSCETLNQTLQDEHPNWPAAVPVLHVGHTPAYVGYGKLGAPVADYFFTEKTSKVTEQFLAEFAEHYVKTLCEIAEHRPVYVLKPVPEMPLDVPTRMGRALILGQDPKVLGITQAQYVEKSGFVIALQEQAAKACGVQILDLTPYFCAQGFCAGAEAGQPLYRDQDHLTESGSRKLVPLFKQINTQP